MYQTPEQMMALNKANLEVAMKFAKTAFTGSIENAKTLAAVKDLQELGALKDSLAQPTLEKATAYAKSLYDVTSATQAEFGKLAEEQIAEFNKQVVTGLDKMVKTAPAGSEVGIAAFKSGIAAVNSAYDNLSKVAKQFTEATQSNFEAVAKQAVDGAKKAKKA